HSIQNLRACRRARPGAARCDSRTIDWTSHAITVALPDRPRRQGRPGWPALFMRAARVRKEGLSYPVLRIKAECFGTEKTLSPTRAAGQGTYQRATTASTSGFRFGVYANFFWGA